MGGAIAKREGGRSLAGTYADGEQASAVLNTARSRGHLVSPATACGDLPEGLGLAITAVEVDVTEETYEIAGGKRGLSKTALDKISLALGVSWDPVASGRVDDGSHPHYCHYLVVGRVRAFDGQEIVIQGAKEMDLRDGSAQVEGLYDRYHTQKADWDSGKSRKKYPPKDPSGQIREMRLHVMSHAETKARLRAIRSLGLRPGYSVADLQKPFVCVRLMFTGESQDPELRREFARARANAMLNAQSSLYGVQPSAHVRQVAAPPPPPPLAARATPVIVDDDDPGLDEAPPPRREIPAESKSSSDDRQATGDWTIPGGPEKGVPLEEAKEKTLTWWIDKIESNLAEKPNSRYAVRDGQLLAAMQAEVERRLGAAADGADDPFAEFSDEPEAG